MTRLLRCSLFLLASLQALSLMLAMERPAHAYVDPGTGLLVFQVGGSMLAGIVYYLRMKIRKMIRVSEPVKAVTPSEAPSTASNPGRVL